MSLPCVLQSEIAATSNCQEYSIPGTEEVAYAFPEYDALKVQMLVRRSDSVNFHLKFTSLEKAIDLFHSLQEEYYFDFLEPEPLNTSLPFLIGFSSNVQIILFKGDAPIDTEMKSESKLIQVDPRDLEIYLLKGWENIPTLETESNTFILKK
jgi:hypothetical protein